MVLWAFLHEALKKNTLLVASMLSHGCHVLNHFRPFLYLGTLCVPSSYVYKNPQKVIKGTSTTLHASNLVAWETANQKLFFCLTSFLHQCNQLSGSFRDRWSDTCAREKQLKPNCYGNAYQSATIMSSIEGIKSTGIENRSCIQSIQKASFVASLLRCVIHAQTAQITKICKAWNLQLCALIILSTHWHV